ncbi:MAG: protein kinase [Myxococcota bacterium]
MPENSTSYYCSRCLTSFSVDAVQCPNLACRTSRPSNGWGEIRNPGDIYDRNYKIHKLLAMGGGGITYLAREINEKGDEVGPRLAIKALFSNRNQGSYLRRLATEAQILQEMNHPHIVQYRGFVHRAGHSPYLVTRFEAGGSLLDHVRRVGTLPVKQAAAIGRQICEALEKSHEMGVVHRDLKPENVLIAEEVPPGVDPHVRVVDFGIAKVNSSLNSNLTRAGAFVGTPHFAAPEQFIGAGVQNASDIYSVGAMLHFCMMGRHLVQFADRLAPEDSYELLVEALPPQINRPDDPPVDVRRMNQVFTVAMAARPGERCTALQLREMLSAIADDADPPIPDIQLLDAAVEPAPQRINPEQIPTAPTHQIEPESLKTPTIPPVQQPQPAAAPGAGRGCLLGVLLVGVLGTILIAVVLGVTQPEWLFGAPTTPTEPTTPTVQIDESLPALTGYETEEPAKSDYRFIYDSLEYHKAHFQEVCQIPDGSSVRLTLEIQSNGLIHKARIDQGIRPDIDDCLRKQLERANVNRNQQVTLRVPKILEWGG